MASSRRTRRPLRRPFALAAAVALGLAAGVTLALREAGRPPGTPPPPADVVVDASAVDRAVAGALRRIGSPVSSDVRPDSAWVEGRRLRWTTRIVTLRTPLGARQVAARLSPEARSAGAVVRVEGSSVRVAVLRAGREVTTHRIQVQAPPAAGRVAIIFDDAGGSLEQLEPVLALGRPATVAVLPGLRYSAEVARRAAAAGLEVLLHQPVEPEDPARALGPGGVRVEMSDEEITRTVAANLAQVPGAVGINNHMGSRGTADPRVMRAILAVARSRGLFFVDSVTSPRSVAARVAQEMGVPAASRAVFLDTDDDPDAIRAQLRRLISMARARGEAVAIGHVTRPTARVLQQMLPEFDREGIVLVPVSALVR
ncbi:MAG: divergent polysaccharide deacetylase family protein [Armatimonadota bacterium]|nr:divergent polysaccharide deacetylase family protein [Armatimonadota bacterium]MDR7404853.1 divergent polysaccharide deacetylase family protein [Armatimonadota bacterium]